MASTNSNSKRAITDKKARGRNRSHKSSLKTMMRKFNTAIANEDVETARKLAPELKAKLDRSAQRNLKHANYAKRHKAKIARSLHA